MEVQPDSQLTHGMSIFNEVLLVSHGFTSQPRRALYEDEAYLGISSSEFHCPAALLVLHRYNDGASVSFILKSDPSMQCTVSEPWGSNSFARVSDAGELWMNTRADEPTGINFAKMVYPLNCAGVRTGTRVLFISIRHLLNCTNKKLLRWKS